MSGITTCGAVVKKVLSPAVPLSSLRHELVGYVYVPSGASLTAKFFVIDRDGLTSEPASGVTLTAGQWNRIYWSDVRLRQPGAG